MLKALIKKEISEVFYRMLHRGVRAETGWRGRRRSRLSGKGMAILMAVLGLYLAGMFTAMAVTLCQAIDGVGMGWLYFLILTGLSVVFGTVGSVFSTCFTLYMAKDNDLLLAMPIPVRDIILSRLLSVYLLGLLYSGLISLPAAAVYLVIHGFSLTALAGGLVLILLISMIVLGLSCLLGWVVAKAIQRLKNRSFLTVLIALVLLIVYYAVYFRFMNSARNLIESAIRVGTVVQEKARLIYLLGRIGQGDPLGMLIWVGLVGAFMALLWLLLKRTFLSIATSTPTAKRAVYRERAVRQGSVDAALLRREWLRFRSSANYMLNCGLGILLLPGAGIYLLIKGRPLIQTLSGSLAGFPGAVTVGLGAVCCLVGSMLDITAPSVSLEGRTIWQVQCLPVTPWQALRAKLALHLGLAAVPTALWLVCVLIAAPADLGMKLLLLAISLLSVLWVALLGLTLGVLKPNLNWVNEVVPIKQSLPVAITIFSAMALGVANLGCYLWFGWRIGPTLWMAGFTLLLLAADGAMYGWLRTRGARRFAEL